MHQALNCNLFSVCRKALGCDQAKLAACTPSKHSLKLGVIWKFRLMPVCSTILRLSHRNTTQKICFCSLATAPQQELKEFTSALLLCAFPTFCLIFPKIF